jgi:hypothetical protein
MSTQLDRLCSTQSPALIRNDGMNDACVVEAVWRAEDIERSYKTWMQQLEDDYRGT